MENDELAQHLESLRREDCYRVGAVLKQSAHEMTQQVYFVGENGAETGPYIRKFIARESGLGDIYERIYRVNKEGRRFAHIPYVLEFQRTDQAIVVVMEHVNGQTLADVVYERDPGVKLAAEVFPALCDAVSELHESFDPPIIHRDLKPSNIMLKNGVPVIIDFGIAREFHDAAETDTTTLGTRAYAPPEQFGYEQTTVRSDVYALGLLLYYLLVEQTPTPKAIRRGFADSRIPEALRQVIAYATAFDPKERYESAAELKEAFLRALATCAPVTATMSTAAERAANTAESAADATGAQATFRWSGAVPLQQDAPLTPVNVEIHVSAPEEFVAEAIAGETAPRAVSTIAPPHPAPGISAPRSPKQIGVKATKGRARNVAIGIICLLFVLVSWSDAVNPSLVANSYPAPYHQYLYGFTVPLVFVLCAYAGLDKGRLCRNYPQIPWPTGGRAILLGVAAVIVAVLLSCPIGIISGVY